ncbi:MAG: hypothetical protein PUJ11_08070 [Eubacteriaceae bacterium]|nr:hypothetical protein [Eubacteriaceae bacterium]
MNQSHDINCNCTICENKCYKTIAFKSGYVCENCLQYIRSQPDQSDKSEDNEVVEISPTDKL